MGLGGGGRSPPAYTGEGGEGRSTPPPFVELSHQVVGKHEQLVFWGSRNGADVILVVCGGLSPSVVCFVFVRLKTLARVLSWSFRGRCLCVLSPFSPLFSLFFGWPCFELGTEVGLYACMLWSPQARLGIARVDGLWPQAKGRHRQAPPPPAAASWRRSAAPRFGGVPCFKNHIKTYVFPAWPEPLCEGISSAAPRRRVRRRPCPEPRCCPKPTFHFCTRCLRVLTSFLGPG